MHEPPRTNDCTKNAPNCPVIKLLSSLKAKMRTERASMIGRSTSLSTDRMKETNYNAEDMMLAMSCVYFLAQLQPRCVSSGATGWVPQPQVPGYLCVMVHCCRSFTVCGGVSRSRSACQRGAPQLPGPTRMRRLRFCGAGAPAGLVPELPLHRLQGETAFSVPSNEVGQ